MYLLYADESGDTGIKPGGTPFFVISGIIVHESKWNEVFQRILELRGNLHARYGIRQRTPFHATDIVNGNSYYHHSKSGLKASQRFDLYHDILEFISQLPELQILNIFIRKDKITSPDVDVFELGWNFFIQRFHNFLEHSNQQGGSKEYGVLFTDRTHDDQLRHLLRRMRAFNYVPSAYPGNAARRVLVTSILDDPIPRASQHSYYVQLADLVAFALARRDYPRSSLQQFNFSSFFEILNPILLTKATTYNPQGVVYWPR